MERDLDNRGDDDKDDASLIDAFFLPGGILDPEDDTDMGYRDGFPKEENPPFLAPSLPSPVSLNPWETSKADPVDDSVAWIGTHSPTLQSRLPEMLLPALSPPRHFGSINPIDLAKVPPPGFHRSSSENVVSVNPEAFLTDGISRKNDAQTLTDQIKIGGSTSFADIIRSSPSATSALPEHKSNNIHSSHYSNKGNDEKSQSIKVPTPRARSSSPQTVRNVNVRSSPNVVHRVRTKQTSKQIGKFTTPSTEWNDVDRNSVGRIASSSSKSENFEATSTVPVRPRFEYPVLLYDYDDDNHNETDSPREPLPVPSQDYSIDVSHTSPTVEANEDTAGENGKARLSHTVSDTEDADAFHKKHCKVVESKDSVEYTPAGAFYESSNANKKYSSSTQSETVNGEIVAVLAPLLEQLLVSTKYAVHFLWNLTQLIAIGARNIFVYATWEASLSGGTLFCYLVLYTLPMFCDWLMTHASLPPFLPHVISAASLYSLSHFPDQPERTTTSRVSDDACRLLLKAFRFYLPLTMLLEGFRGSNSMIMLLDKSTRIILAYLLSMLRAGFLTSPVGWFGWSIQVILSLWLPEGHLSSCILSLLGLALLRLTSVVPDRKTTS